MFDWYDHPLDSRAVAGGEQGVNGREYKGGEFLPFYVPRSEMPQIDEADYPAFFEFVKARGWSYHLETVDPHTLRAHQRVSWNKVITMTPAELAKPILVSRDGYVLDGNHRREGHIRQGSDVQAYVLNLDFEAAIRLLFSFPKTYAYGDGNQHRKAF